MEKGAVYEYYPYDCRLNNNVLISVRMLTQRDSHLLHGFSRVKMHDLRVS